MNREIVEKSIDAARSKLWLAGTPYLIHPVETSLAFRTDNYWEKLGPGYEPASIPEITCLAQFDCLDTALNPVADFSSLSIVWFQDEFALPIDPSILQSIRAIDWRAYAKECYW
jgi:hypothetical protein